MCGGKVIRKVEKLLGLLNDDKELSISKLKKLIESSEKKDGTDLRFYEIIFDLCDKVNEHIKSKDINMAKQAYNTAESVIMYTCNNVQGSGSFYLYIVSIAVSMASTKLHYYLGDISTRLVVQFSYSVSERLKEISKYDSKDKFIQKHLHSMEKSNRLAYSSRSLV